ncbi:hypothetical protein G9A89_004551 [Geosiphon pyriformis]|nr:hypothetical protein G9A89_004551 [Geosiphon pyriformis]
MAYAPIAKLNNFTGEEDDTQIWLNDVEKAIAANGWNDARMRDPNGGFSELEIEVNILMIDRLVAASWAGNYFDIGLNSDLDNDLEFGTSDWGFDIDFPIFGYLDAGDSQFGYDLVYHNSGRYMFSIATVDWSIKMDVIDFGHN